AAARGEAVHEAPAGPERLRRRRLPVDVRVGRRTGPPEPAPAAAVHLEAPPRALAGGGGPAPLRSVREASPPATSERAVAADRHGQGPTVDARGAAARR